jgi:hypothetical protein
LLSDTVFKIRSATSVLRRVVRSGYKEADLRYEKSGGAERTVRFSFLNGLALSGQAPAAADARRGVFRPERICGLHAAGAVPHCAAGGGSALRRRGIRDVVHVRKSICRTGSGDNPFYPEKDADFRELCYLCKTHHNFVTYEPL